MLPTLIQLPYSPWSERARWALDARRVPYARRTYQPLFGEPELRLRLRRWRGPVTVPVLITDEGVLGDSWDIARWADERGHGERLFPDGAEERIRRWNEWSQRALAAGRALALARMVKSDVALDELVPRPLRRLGAAARALARAGVERARRKYETTGRDHRDWRDELVRALDELEAALGPDPAAGPATLLGAFSYADITAAQVLASVTPPESRHMRFGPETRRLFGEPELQQRYAALVAWRDALYARYRDAE